MLIDFMDVNYKGNTNIRSELTKHLFLDFRNAYFHFKPRMETDRRFNITFYFGIEFALQILCEDEEAEPSHISNTHINELHSRCERMVSVLKPMQLDDKDKMMLDVVVKTGNYLAIILDLIAQDSALNTQDSRLKALESTKRKSEDVKEKSGRGGVKSGKRGPGLSCDLQSLCLLGQDI